jgi:hypothetical protein
MHTQTPKHIDQQRWKAKTNKQNKNKQTQDTKRKMKQQRCTNMQPTKIAPSPSSAQSGAVGGVQSSLRDSDVINLPFGGKNREAGASKAA